MPKTSKKPKRRANPKLAIAVATIQELTLERHRLNDLQSSTFNLMSLKSSQLEITRDALRDLHGFFERFGQGPWLEHYPDVTKRIAEIRTLVHGSQITSHESHDT